MRHLKHLAMVSLLAFCISSCSGQGNKDTKDSSVQEETTKTEMTTLADNQVTPEAAQALAKKVTNSEALTSDDYNAMLDYVLQMAAKMDEAIKKTDIDAITKIPSEFPESDMFIKALDEAASSGKLDKDQLDKAYEFKELIGECEGEEE